MMRRGHQKETGVRKWRNGFAPERPGEVKGRAHVSTRFQIMERSRGIIEDDRGFGLIAIGRTEAAVIIDKLPFAHQVLADHQRVRKAVLPAFVNGGVGIDLRVVVVLTASQKGQDYQEKCIFHRFKVFISKMFYKIQTMQTVKTLILFLFMGLAAHGQDTITVNTFTWSSESRDSVFEFPDNAGQTYHKIIMEYGMRCHDLEVGNGAVGCREWDYSCNTIVYDSTRTDSVLVDDGNGALVYETSSPVRYEIMSFVTPYGNGLDLGPKGKTWTFDVTDYAPILKGKKRMALVGGGEFQEEMQITFKFITGTPEREVLDIRPVWPLQFGVSGGPINDDLRFEPREVQIPNNVEHVKIKSVITGHGQTGEFTPFQHRLDINNDRRVTYRIWKECSDVPVYPQGGTWLLDRAGWCPGDPSQENTTELTPDEMASGSFTIDYSVRDLVQAPDLRYIVNHQMVFYGPYNFNTDFSIHDIIRPNDQVEHARLNPVCFKPKVVIRNGGKEVVNYATIEYGIAGGQQMTYSWGGMLRTGETDTVELDYPPSTFTGLQGPTRFAARIVESDDYDANNQKSVTFDPVAHYKGERVLLLLTTNKAPTDNDLTLKDADGNVVLEYDDLEASRSYFDEVVLAPGCYEMLLTDSRDDGLYYWAYEQNGPNIGRGGLEIFVDDVSVHEFEPEFGRFVQYAFAIESPTSTGHQEYSRLRIYPNPTKDMILIDTEGEPGSGRLTIQTLDGRIMGSHRISGMDERIDVSHLGPGAYILLLEREGRQHRTTMIKQ